uniref:Uncharacterized protein n=1 Tax=Panagrolaimus davidi TaxID=227884 RepID=A0A914QXD0_9BILA
MKPLEERSAVGFGWLFLGTAAVIWAIYIPFIIVMCDRDLLKHSCYKLMVFMGFLDLHTSLYVGGVAGIFCIKGYVFCQWPTLWFWIGCLHGMAWKMQCSSVVLLAFNRCLEAFNPKWSNILFSGKRTLSWMILPVLWGLRDIVFGPPVYFSPMYMTLTYDPHVGYFSDTKNMVRKISFLKLL